MRKIDELVGDESRVDRFPFFHIKIDEHITEVADKIDIALVHKPVEELAFVDRVQLVDSFAGTTEHGKIESVSYPEVDIVRILLDSELKLFFRCFVITALVQLGSLVERTFRHTAGQKKRKKEQQHHDPYCLALFVHR